MKYKILVMEEIGKLAIREAEVPHPGKDQVLVKIMNCNICTTDWQNWNGMRGHSNKSFPYAPGHEAAGIIEEIGENVYGFNVGDHVAVGYTGCGYCDDCRNSDTNSCKTPEESQAVEGVTGGFGMSQYMLIKKSQVFEMNPELPFAEAGYLEPVSTSVHGVRKLAVNPGEYLLVIGAGNMGLVNAQVARAFGCNVFVSEVDEKRIALSKSMGFEVVNPLKEDVKEFAKKVTRGHGLDHVIVCVGNTPATDQAFEVVRKGGKILLFAAGYPSPELHLDVNKVHYGNWHIIGTGGASAIDYRLACQYLSDGTVDTKNMISYKVSLNDYNKAFELAATPGNYRVSLVMWD